MSRRLWALPLRAFSEARQPASQWVCRRCFASQVDGASGGGDNTAPPPTSNGNMAGVVARKARDSSVLSKSVNSQHDWSHLKHLREPLPHAVPPQYLEYCHDSALSAAEREQRGPMRKHKQIQGVVVSAGKMKKTVKVRVPRQQWNNRIGKFFDAYDSHLVHDPNDSLIAGDVVDLHRLRASSTVHHVVAAIVSPFGKPIDQRPPVPSPEERLDAYKADRLPKLRRRDIRKRAAAGDADAIAEVEAMDAAVASTAPSAKRGQGRQRKGEAGAGKLNQLAIANAKKAKRLEDEARENVAEAKVAAKGLEERGLAADSAIAPDS